MNDLLADGGRLSAVHRITGKRRHIQQVIHGHRGRRHDPLYSARRTLHTGTDLLTEKQQSRLAALFASDEHVQVEVTWWIYQRMITAHREPDRTRGRDLMTQCPQLPPGQGHSSELVPAAPVSWAARLGGSR